MRPSSYIEINNFYTPTVYEKGAELCRMMHTLIGETAFRKAMDTYFDRFDGDAATVEDFVDCMADASGRDLSQFFIWYEQSGTPRLTVTTAYDAKNGVYDVSVSQVTLPTPGQREKKPLHMPLRIGLVGRDGHDLQLHLDGTGRSMIRSSSCIRKTKCSGFAMCWNDRFCRSTVALRHPSHCILMPPQRIYCF